MSFGMFVLVVVVVVVLVLLVSAGSRDRGSNQAATQRGCPHCGAVHPHFAAFCRRCGKRLG